MFDLPSSPIDLNIISTNTMKFIDQMNIPFNYTVVMIMFMINHDPLFKIFSKLPWSKLPSFSGKVGYDYLNDNLIKLLNLVKFGSSDIEAGSLIQEAFEQISKSKTSVQPKEIPDAMEIEDFNESNTNYDLKELFYECFPSPVGQCFETRHIIGMFYDIKTIINAFGIKKQCVLTLQLLFVFILNIQASISTRIKTETDVSR